MAHTDTVNSLNETLTHSLTHSVVRGAVTRRLKNTTTRPLQGNPPWIHAPWVGLSRRVGIFERDQAIDDANRIARAGIASLYPDASVTTRLAAIAVARRNKEGAVVVL